MASNICQVKENVSEKGWQACTTVLGPVARSLVSTNRWLRGIKMYRFPWQLMLVSTNHASSNPGLGYKLHQQLGGRASDYLAEPPNLVPRSHSVLHWKLRSGYKVSMIIVTSSDCGETPIVIVHQEPIRLPSPIPVKWEKQYESKECR